MIKSALSARSKQRARKQSLLEGASFPRKKMRKYLRGQRESFRSPPREALWREGRREGLLWKKE